MTIALFLFSFLAAGNEARIDDEDDDDDVVEHDDDIEHDDEKMIMIIMKKMNFKTLWWLWCWVEDDNDLGTHSDNDNMNADNEKADAFCPQFFLVNYKAFSHDVTAAILVFQISELEAMLVSQTNHLFLCKRFLLLQ